MDERRLEVRVGALILATLAAIFALLWAMGELSFGRGGHLAVDFAHTGSVVPGAPVKLAGVEVGKVDKVRLLADRRDPGGLPLPVRMELSVSSSALAALRSDALVTVSSQGPLGESYLELNPGSAAAAPLAPKAVLRGQDAPRLDVVANRLSKFLEALTSVLEDDPEAFASLVKGLSELSLTAGGVLRDNRGQITAVAGELSTAAHDLRVLAQLARAALEPGGKGARILDDTAEVAKVARRDLPEIAAGAKKTFAGLGALAGGLGPDEGKQLQSLLARLSAASDKLDSMATRAERVLARIEAGEGTLGGLQKDPALYNDLKSLIADLRKHPWKVLWKE